ncbi:MAG: bifunctional methionine sulfoxide reductase B/A protein [Victivallaceae bacterium]|nr:bifunctional methionine sulfoxide reductase B/A protein [Victivallaceae bacterium]
MPYGPLTDAEKQVIEEAKTDAPGTGKYNNLYDTGVYTCRKCGALLYSSDDKFNARCGWPSFDDALPGAVKRKIDPDGVRMEIVCAKCNAHLGHVFTGEMLTQRNTRHCVNSTSMVFEGQSDSPRVRRAVFAGGCFWGVEALMKQEKGVLRVLSGYTGGRTKYPTYNEVSTGLTGHAEAVEVFYDPRETDFEKLCRAFLEIHDPTQLNRQGPDHGMQYRSGIFYFDRAQRDTAQKLLDQLRARGYAVQTKLTPFHRFYTAEPYHLNHYERNGGASPCHRRVNRFGL